MPSDLVDLVGVLLFVIFGRHELAIAFAVGVFSGRLLAAIFARPPGPG